MYYTYVHVTVVSHQHSMFELFYASKEEDSKGVRNMPLNKRVSACKYVYIATLVRFSRQLFIL